MMSIEGLRGSEMRNIPKLNQIQGYICMFLTKGFGPMNFHEFLSCLKCIGRKYPICKKRKNYPFAPRHKWVEKGRKDHHVFFLKIISYVSCKLEVDGSFSSGSKWGAIFKHRVL